MIEIYRNLYLHPGEILDVVIASFEKGGNAVVSAARDPWYSRLKGKSNPSDPEYLYALRNKHLYLNMVDADDVSYFQPEMINEAIVFIDKQLEADNKVLLHCNHGQSRSPSIALLYLAMIGVLPPDHDTAVSAFKVMYPYYSPNQGIKDFLSLYWREYITT